MSLNIAGIQSIDDPEYRYKMPRLLAKIEGRGNGIKTVIVNCVDIAYSLHRTPPEITKFFGCELGAQSKYDDKTERSVVNGAFEASIMQQQLSKFIEIFVLCPSCRLPETKYKFKGHSISHKCAACGAMNLLDMHHKLTTYILKEHASNKRNKKKDKDDKKKRREKKDKSSSDPADDGGSNEGRSPSDKEKKNKIKRKKKEKEVVEIEWHTDLSEEAVAARAHEARAIEAAALRALEDVNSYAYDGDSNTFDDDDDSEDVPALENCRIDDLEAIANAIRGLKAFLTCYHPTDEIVAEVVRQQTIAALPVKDRLAIFFQAVIDHNVIQDNQIFKHGKVFNKLVINSDAQLTLLACCELACVVTFPELSSCMPVIVKMFYDKDILDEENILNWNRSKIRGEYCYPEITDFQAEELRASLKPFIEWLENAEEESDDE